MLESWMRESLVPDPAKKGLSSLASTVDLRRIRGSMIGLPGWFNEDLNPGRVGDDRGKRIRHDLNPGRVRGDRFPSRVDDYLHSSRVSKDCGKRS